MSYIFSRALVEACLQGKCSDTAASALLSGSPTPPLFLPNDKTTAFSRLSRFGMTFGHLTDDLGAELLTSWLEGFPAKTSALQEKAQASPESVPACGPTWRASLAKYDPDSCSWKTAQLCLLGDSELSLVTWPRSGMTAGGQCWELPMLERPTAANDSGLWPTPVASDTTSRTKPYAQGGTPLSLAVKWPTPSTIGINGGSHSRAAAKKRGATSALLNGGSLNPGWVEWLMNWPIGWTSLEPLQHDQTELWKKSSAAHVSSTGLPAVWWHHDPSAPPQGQEPNEQQPGERRGPVQSVPCGGAQAACASGLQGVRGAIHPKTGTQGDAVQQAVPVSLGEGIGGQTLVPRVSNGVTARVDRLKAIGNGQVPRCAAEAWRLLTTQPKE